MIIDRKGNMPLYRQIYDQLRIQILSGALAEGTPLQSSRQLAENISVSRSVVMEAYEHLKAEGYVESNPGGYTRVACHLKTHYKAQPVSKQAIKNYVYDEYQWPFKTGLPDLDHFPRKVWSKYLTESLQSMDSSDLGYINASGDRVLRATIVDYLYRSKSLQVSAENIVIVSGATQGLSLVSGILKNGSDICMVEDPSSIGTQKILKSAGYQLEGIPVDKEGICTACIDIKKPCNFIYTTPAHQFPLGGILSVGRRLALLEKAEKMNCYIIEDDYDGEYRFDGHAITPIAALDGDRVIYIASFSKVLLPGIRLGFVVLPDALVKPMRYLKRYSDVHSGVIEQRALALFIESGAFERHLFKMKKLYRKKRTLLIASLQEVLSDEVVIEGADSGLHLVVKFKRKEFQQRIVAYYSRSESSQFQVQSHRVNKGADDYALILGYGHIGLEDISGKVKELYAVAKGDI